MREQKIKVLLSVEKSTIPISVRMPKILLDRILECYEIKVGAMKSRGAISNAVLYFAARGVLDWEMGHEEAQQRLAAHLEAQEREGTIIREGRESKGSSVRNAKPERSSR